MTESLDHFSSIFSIISETVASAGGGLVPQEEQGPESRIGALLAVLSEQTLTTPCVYFFTYETNVHIGKISSISPTNS